MNYPPPTAPAPASARNRRSQRNGSGRKRPAHRRPGSKKRRHAAPMTMWQGIVLGALLLAVVFAALAPGFVTSMEKDLLARREQQYQDSLASIQKNYYRNRYARYREWIEYYAASYQIDPAYVAAIIKRESDYDPRAVSQAGAMGLMQFMPDTFDWVAPNCGISKNDRNAVYEPEKAIKMGCYLLRYICRKMETDDPILVACAYHAGWGNVQNWLQKYSKDGKTLTLDQIPMSDTRDYAGKVLNAYAIYQQHDF